MFTASMWVCVCCDLDHILGISEASVLRAERALAQTVGHKRWHSVAEVVLCGIQSGRLHPVCLKEPQW